MKLAQGLRVSVEELLSPPFSPVEHIPAGKLPRLQQAQGNVEIVKILPEVRSGFTIERVTVKAGFRMKGSPHKKGTKEYLCCLQGSITLHTEGEKFSVGEGDLLIFPGDQHHSYLNDSNIHAEFISIVSLPN